MRICFIGDASGYHVSRWIKYFPEKGHEVHIISTGEASIPGVKVHYLKNKYRLPGLRHLFYYQYFRTAKTILDNLRPDVVHALQANLYAALACLAKYRPFVVTPFGGDVLVNPQKSLLSRIIAQYCLSHADFQLTERPDALGLQSINR